MKQIRTKQDDAVLQAVQDIGIEVHKDELIKALQYDRGQYDKGYADGQKDAKEAQNIDPESLRPQGEWEMGKSGVVYFCSECDMWAFPVEVRKWHFCPNCGAKMRKVGGA